MGKITAKEQTRIISEMATFMQIEKNLKIVGRNIFKFARAQSV